MTRRIPLHFRPAQSRLAKATAGFSLLELAIVICVSVVIVFFILDRALFYQEVAEKTAVEVDIIQLRSAVRHRKFDLLLKHREQDLASMAGMNPVAWLASAPSNYVGELDQPRWEDVPAGCWYFDLHSRLLVYKIKQGRHFVPSQDEKKAIKLRVEALTKSPHLSVPTGAIGIGLITVEPYQWF